MAIYIVRHGETEENKQRILQGHLPGTLTPNGREQMVHAAEQLVAMHVGASCIVASDLKRATESAQIIASRLGLPIVTTPELRERDWGKFTGMSIAEATDRFRINGRWAFPKGTVETEAEIFARACKALSHLQEQYAGETIIVVTHGMFARNLIAAKFGGNYHEVTPLLNSEIRKL